MRILRQSREPSGLIQGLQPKTVSCSYYKRRYGQDSSVVEFDNSSNPKGSIRALGGISWQRLDCIAGIINHCQGKRSIDAIRRLEICNGTAIA